MSGDTNYFEKIAHNIVNMPPLPIPDIAPLPDVTIRYSVPQDIVWLKNWLVQPEALRAYPMCTDMEVDDAARRWISFSRLRSSLTIEYKKSPIGIATLHIHWYKRLSHQCDFAIIVHPEYRGKGFGSFLLSSVMKFAKKQFRIDLLHLQVYKDNPAINLYTKFGFQEFGRHPAWIKELGEESTTTTISPHYLSVLYMGRML